MQDLQSELRFYFYGFEVYVTHLFVPPRITEFFLLCNLFLEFFDCSCLGLFIGELTKDKYFLFSELFLDYLRLEFLLGIFFVV